MDYHLLTKKCDGMCDSCECPPAEFECLGEPSLCTNPRGCACAPDPTLKPDIAALKKRLAEDPGFAAQVTGDRPLRRNVDGVCTRSTCECEREGLGDQCVWLKPADRRPAPGCHTPEGCRENGCLGWCDEHKPEAARP